MVKKMSELITKTITKELASDEKDVVKLRNLNRNPILNKYLKNKQHNELIQTIIQLIENGKQSTDSTNVLKFYLHELGLIFNLNMPQNYFQGVV